MKVDKILEILLKIDYITIKLSVLNVNNWKQNVCNI